jgi:hypothetical protein
MTHHGVTYWIVAGGQEYNGSGSADIDRHHHGE